MDYAIISGDIVASTSLSIQGKKRIDEGFRKLLNELKGKFDVFGRIIKGDYIECYVPENTQSLRVALSIKSFIKSLNIDINDDGFTNPGRSKLYKTYGIRLAIGLGDLLRLDIDNGIIDGEAIYYSGRIINELKTSNKQKVSIKNTLFIKSNDSDFDSQINALLALIDVILSKGTAKQCQILYYKLLGYEEKEIGKMLNIRQSTINQHSTGVGWLAIEKAVLLFENIMTKKNGVG